MKIKQKIENIIADQKRKFLALKEKAQLKNPTIRSGIPSGEKVKKDSTEKISRIGGSILFRGELFGRESLYIYGTVEGKISLKDHNILIEPEGKVKGEVQVKRIEISGEVSGNIYATELVNINKTGTLSGDIFSPRISIADGAYLEGNLNTTKPTDWVSSFKKKREKEEEKNNKD